MKLTRARVRGLFGLFDHDISFPMGEPLVIIIGPNGFGKTVFLRMISALVSGQAGFLLQTPFTEFVLDFDDGSVRRAQREPGDEEGSKHTLRLEHIHADGTVRAIRPAEVTQVSPRLLDQLDPFVPHLRRYRDGWRDSQGQLFTLQDVIAKQPSLINRLPPSLRKGLSSQAMDDFTVYVVETNRLMSTKPPVSDRSYRQAYVLETDFEESTPLRVVQYAADISRRIQSVLAAYAKHSQESDRTFPERLVEFLRTHATALPERDILSEMKDLEGQRQRLIDLGFLDKETGLTDLTEEDVKNAREALTIYVRDVTEKLRVFEDMALRIGTLTDIINDRFKYKKVRLHREHGFVLVSDTGAPVDLATLSSGEQHQLVLLYELLFLVPKSGLVLVDEPEISLHVAWQTRFLKDLITILGITGAQAMIATHAPAIIGNRWDLAVGLRGPGSEESESDATAI